jgi:hypothetical protein
MADIHLRRRARRVKPRPPQAEPPGRDQRQQPDPAADFSSVVDAVLLAALAALEHVDALQPTVVERALRDVVTACAGTSPLHRHAVKVAATEQLAQKMSAVNAKRFVALAFGEDPPPPDAPKGTPAPAPLGRAISYEDDDPDAHAVELADLLDDLHAFLVAHVHLPDSAAVVIALWCVHTYLADCVRRTPYLIINSPIKGCGKSTLLDVIALLAYRAQAAANATPAVLFRLIAQHHPTLLLDEADRWLAGKTANPDLIALVNAGNTKGTPCLRTVGDAHEPAAFDVYGPKALAGIGDLPDTIVDRGIVIAMRRKPKTAKVERITRTSAASARTLRSRIVRWTQDQHDPVAAVDLDTVTLPDALHNRRRDCFESLAAIAGFAGLAWVDALQAAATRLSKDVDDTDGVGVRLLRDVRSVFGEQHKEKLLSITICDALAALDDDEAPWARWHRHARDEHDRRLQPTDLAKLLRPFGVRPRQVKIGSQGGKGYHFADLADALERYVGEASASDQEEDDDDDAD